MAISILVHKKSRRARIFGYLLLCAAGVLLICANDLFLYQIWIWTTMASFLAFGGAICAFGQWKRIWPPEYMGLPLIWTSMAVFLVYQTSTLVDLHGLMLILGFANICLFSAFVVLMFSRWLDVAAVYKAAKDYSNAKR